MERQDTQPALSDEDFSFLLQQNPSLLSDDLMPGSEENCSLFEDLQPSSNKCNNSDDEQLQQQQIQHYQHQQLVLVQQQHAQQQQPQQHHNLSNTQNAQRNLKNLVVASVKRETVEGSGMPLHSDSLSSTPPELLQGVSYSAVHAVSPNALNGSMASKYSAAPTPSGSSSSTQVYYNQMNAYGSDACVPHALYSQNSFVGASMTNRALAHNGAYSASHFQPMQLQQVSQMNDAIPGMFLAKNEAMAIVAGNPHSNPASGCTTLRLQNQVEVYQNVPLRQVAELTCISNNTNNFNTTNGLSNSYTVPETHYNGSELMYPSITSRNNHSAPGTSSNCGSSKFPEPYSTMGPYSPTTLETTNFIAATLGENSGIPQQVQEQHQQFVAPQEIQEKKFAPQEQKFILPESNNEVMLKADGIDDEMEGRISGLPRGETIDVTTLNNWPGEHNFQIKVQPNDKQRNKWCYSSKVHRLYCYPMLAAEVQVSVNDWLKAGCHNAEVRVVPVYQDAQNRIKPVHRCHNCKKSNQTADELMNHMVQVSNSGAVHSVTSSRYSVSVPLIRSHRGEDNVTLLITCTCMSSCVGGPNRRPFALLFSLMMDGEEKGRQVLSTKCCKGPNRDIKKDETDHDRRLGLVVEDSNPPAEPAVSISPKKPNLAIAGSSGVTPALPSPKTMAAKRKAIARKMLVDIFSSDSESERSSSKKTKLGNGSASCVVGGTRGTFITSTDAAPDGFATLLIPLDIKNDVVKYAESLLALKYVKNNRPNLLKIVELQ